MKDYNNNSRISSFECEESMVLSNIFLNQGGKYAQANNRKEYLHRADEVDGPADREGARKKSGEMRSPNQQEYNL
jgi:hypothetical protein